MKRTINKRQRYSLEKELLGITDSGNNQSWRNHNRQAGQTQSPFQSPETITHKFQTEEDVQLRSQFGFKEYKPLLLPNLNVTGSMTVPHRTKQQFLSVNSSQQGQQISQYIQSHCTSRKSVKLIILPNLKLERKMKAVQNSFLRIGEQAIKHDESKQKRAVLILVKAFIKYQESSRSPACSMANKLKLSEVQIKSESPKTLLYKVHKCILRETSIQSAVKLQAWVRGFSQRSKFIWKRNCVLRIQRFFRGTKIKRITKNYQTLVNKRSVPFVQKFLRGFLIHKQLKQQIQVNKQLYDLHSMWYAMQPYRKHLLTTIQVKLAYMHRRVKRRQQKLIQAQQQIENERLVAIEIERKFGAEQRLREQQEQQLRDAEMQKAIFAKNLQQQKEEMLRELNEAYLKQKNKKCVPESVLKEHQQQVASFFNQNIARKKTQSSRTLFQATENQFASTERRKGVQRQSSVTISNFSSVTEKNGMQRQASVELPSPTKTLRTNKVEAIKEQQETISSVNSSNRSHHSYDS